MESVAPSVPKSAREQRVEQDDRTEPTSNNTDPEILVRQLKSRRKLPGSAHVIPIGLLSSRLITAL